MKIRSLLAVVMLVLVLFIVGCGGIPKQQYDTTVADLNKAQQELQTVKAEFQAAQAKIAELEKIRTELKAAQDKAAEITSSLDKSQTELKAVQTKLDSAQAEATKFKSDLRTLWAPLYALVGLNEAILGVAAAVILNQKDVIPTRAATLTGRIANFDPELKALWEQAYVTDATGWKLNYASFERLMGTVAQRMAYRATDIRNKLP